MSGCRAMAGSLTPKPTASNPCLAPLSATVLSFPVGVAFSGGADSTALLHAAVQLWPGQVLALHVHHGLQAAADDFAIHAQNACQALRVPLHVERVDARHQSGQSPEAVARLARYAALARMAKHEGLAQVLLAQHADDQVETMLLALSRGAGLAGMSGMAGRFRRHEVEFVRPILNVSAMAIRGWLETALIAHVEDPSNADEDLTRNRIRRRLMPVLELAFPQFRDTFLRSSRHASQAQEMLDEVGASDLNRVGRPPNIRAWQQLSGLRQINALRTWLRVDHGAIPSEAQLVELASQLRACITRGHGIQIKIADGWVQRDGECIRFKSASDD